MRWWRAHGGLGARVALFALILQLALAFGHIHAPRADAPGLGAPVAATSDPGGDTGDHGDDYCATCAILAQLAGAQTAAAPAVALPAERAAAVEPVAAATVRLAARHDSFQSRAPPNS